MLASPCLVPAPPTDSTDGELLSHWRAGDRAAGKTLYDRHAASVVRFFRNKVQSACDDLVQQTFESCLRGQNEPRDPSRFRLFLLGIARHKLYDHLFRGRGNKMQVEDMTSSIADMDPTPSSVAARHERDRQLALCLRTIPLALQLLLELHYWEELTTTELAEVLEIPQGTVKTRLMRARALLRERLAEAPGLGELAVSDAGLDTWARSVRGRIDFDSG